MKSYGTCVCDFYAAHVGTDHIRHDGVPSSLFIYSP